MIAARDFAHARDDLVDALAHDIVRAVHEVDDGVGRCLDPFDEIGIERERRPVEPRHGDHLSVPGPRASRGPIGSALEAG